MILKNFIIENIICMTNYFYSYRSMWLDWLNAIIILKRESEDIVWFNLVAFIAIILTLLIVLVYFSSRIYIPRACVNIYVCLLLSTFFINNPSSQDHKVNSDPKWNGTTSSCQFAREYLITYFDAPFRWWRMLHSALICSREVNWSRQTAAGGRATDEIRPRTISCSGFLHDIRSFYYAPRRSRIRDAFRIAEGSIHHDGWACRDREYGAI